LANSRLLCQAARAGGLAICLAIFPSFASAWELGGPLYTSRYPVPPSYYGYNLDETNPGYFGGGRYKEYYSYGRGYGLANFPDSLPDWRAPGAIRYYYRPMPVIYPPSGTVDPSSIEVPQAVRLEVQLPHDAELWIEGTKTRQRGSMRHFISPALVPGHRYAFELRARWNDNEKPVEQTQQVTARPGETKKIRFPGPTDAESLPAPKPLPLLIEP
jgi:uncharacterized protein (TIGR03000 family)